MTHLNRVRFNVLLLALLAGFIFTLAVINEWLQGLPGFRCESFGCVGLGIIYFGMACVIPILFGVLGFWLGRPRRIRIALEALAIAVVVMLSCGAVIGIHARSTVINGCEAAVQACQQYPQACTAVDLQNYRSCSR